MKRKLIVRPSAVLDHADAPTATPRLGRLSLRLSRASAAIPGPAVVTAIPSRLQMVRLHMLTAVILVSAVQLSAGTKMGTYAQSAVSIWSAKLQTVTSPDGTKAIVAGPPDHADSDETHKVIVRAYGRTFRTRIGLLVNAEVLWSPDSRAFSVTYSTGGNVGTYHVKVVYVSPAGLQVVEPVKQARRLFAPICFTPEDPNVGVIAWTAPARLAIAIEVPPHSSCAAMGTFRAFEIGLPDGRVLNRYSQAEAKRVFAKELGVELQNADDHCAEITTDCYPDGLLPPKRQKQPSQRRP